MTDAILALGLFALASSITPGPNNLMLLASGANYGFRRTLPHMLGVGLGFTIMVLLVGLGLAQIFVAYPRTYQVLKVACVGYLIFLAWKIARTAPISEPHKAGAPMTFLQAAGFQWVNPKAWTMAVTATTVYSLGPSVASVAVVAIVFGLVNLPSVGVWVLAGQRIARLLNSPYRLGVFNWTMAGLLVASLYPMVFG